MISIASSTSKYHVRSWGDYHSLHVAALSFIIQSALHWWKCESLCKISSSIVSPSVVGCHGHTVSSSSRLKSKTFISFVRKSITSHLDPWRVFFQGKPLSLSAWRVWRGPRGSWIWRWRLWGGLSQWQQVG